MRQQRLSRGNRLGRVLQSVAPGCETCDEPLHEHAHSCQDALLDTILELADHLGQRAHRLHDLNLAPFCGEAQRRTEPFFRIEASVGMA